MQLISAVTGGPVRLLADRFEAAMGALAEGFVHSSSEVADAARNLASTAEETSRQAQAVAGAAETASENMQTVAAGTEELSALWKAERRFLPTLGKGRADELMQRWEQAVRQTTAQ